MKPALNKFTLARYWLLFAAMMVAVSLQAETWHATVGAQDENKGRQVVAFLPNELWIHAGDSVEWNVKADEPHTLTFLTAGQIRPPFPVGCPGYSFGTAIVDGSTCVSSSPLVSGQSFSVMFPSPGNFKLVCLVHPDQTGVVHVLETTAALPHGQEFYDEETANQANELLADLARLQGHSPSCSLGQWRYCRSRKDAGNWWRPQLNLPDAVHAARTGDSCGRDGGVDE